MGALLLICSAKTLFAQIDPGLFIDRDPSSLATVSRNQLLAPGKALQAIKRARADVVGGHLESAQKEIARALDIAPHFAVAKVMQGAIDIETEHYEAARTLFQEAINDDPALGGAYVGMAVVLIHDRRFQAALPLLDRAEGLLPGAWFVHFAKAWDQLEIGNPEAAIKQADVAERLAGTDAERRSAGSYLRAMVSIHLKDVSTARQRLVEAVERDRGGKYAALASKQLESLQAVSVAAR
jgi:tetratricopeptide (TPR) repeat protein